jgi:hypothetical protein
MKMSKPWIHSKSSARKFGGTPEDYLDIHNFIDSSKAVIADNRHRALTHNSWFIGTVLERVFGTTFENSAGKIISVRDIGEQHVIEDMGCIPSGQDYLAELEYHGWMEGRGKKPPSFAKITSSQKVTTTEFKWDKD